MIHSTLISLVFPLGGQLSLYGTISFGQSQFNSFAVQDLPVPGFNVVAVYWSHWVHSNLGEVYFQVRDTLSTDTQIMANRTADKEIVICI